MKNLDLFSDGKSGNVTDLAPLAERMRPQKLADYIGQQHLLGKGCLLRRAIEADKLFSMIFWGPPGSGKPPWPESSPTRPNPISSVFPLFCLA